MFAQHMIPHHQQAIEMSDMILAKQGIDPRVVELANQIKVAQGPEIEQMQGWLKEWGQPTMPMMPGMEMPGQTGMPGMPSPSATQTTTTLTTPARLARPQCPARAECPGCQVQEECPGCRKCLGCLGCPWPE